MSPKFNDFTTVKEQRRALEGFSKLSILPRKTKFESLYLGNLKAEWISADKTPDKGTVLSELSGLSGSGWPSANETMADDAFIIFLQNKRQVCSDAETNTTPA